ncbi:MAG: DUF3791 domain-containing protein [Marinilabiliaceae bacterium]|nr:DUF3791 domain-containing protein [Marinilabiliaceae bacterium]
MTQNNVEYITAVIGTLSTKLGLPCSRIYRSLNEAGLIQNYLVKCYDVLHTLSLEYVAEDVVNYMTKKGLTL